MSTYEHEDSYGYHDSYHHDEYDDDDGMFSVEVSYTYREVKEDLFDLLALAHQPEIEGLKQAFIQGRIDGSMYIGECACLVGTIAKLRGWEDYDADEWQVAFGLRLYLTPAEWFCYGVERGDTPETSSVAKMFVKWIDEYLQKP